MDKFFEKFAGCAITSLIDFFSEYNQIELTIKYRDFTRFQTPFKLIRLIIISQGVMNSPTQFIRTVITMLKNHTQYYHSFFNDIGVCGPKIIYNNKKARPGVGRYILELIQDLDKVLTDLERAGATIAGTKSQFGIPKIKIISYVCDIEECYLNIVKVIKILEWTYCDNISEARAFISVYIYFRI